LLADVEAVLEEIRCSVFSGLRRKKNVEIWGNEKIRISDNLYFGMI